MREGSLGHAVQVDGGAGVLLVGRTSAGIWIDRLTAVSRLATVRIGSCTL